MVTHGRPAYLLVLCHVSPYDYGSPCLVAEFPITLSLLAFRPTRSSLFRGHHSQPCEGVLESRFHPMTRPKQERLTNMPSAYQGCPVSRPSAMPRVRWFLPEVSKVPVIRSPPGFSPVDTLWCPTSRPSIWVDEMIWLVQGSKALR